MRLRHVLGGIALSLFSLLGASQAFAQADPCAGPFPGPNVSIVKSGDCTISSEINVAGTVSIQITGGSLTDASNIAGGSVSISQSGGTTTLAGLASSGAINVSSDGALSIGSVSSQSGVTASSGNSDINVGGAIYVEGAVQLTANNGKINAQTITANFQPVTLSSSGTLTTGAVNAPSADVTATSTNGDIDVTGDINAQGAVKLTAANGNIAAQAINSGGNLVSLNADSIQGTSVSAGAYVYAKSTTGSIKFSGDVTANTSGNGYDLRLYAQTDLATGNLSNAGYTGGWIDLWSNMGGASSSFTIDGSGSTNGVNGTITATASAGSTLVLVQNGTASSTGDITLANASAIHTTNLGAPTGSVWINANQGTVSIQAGTLSVDGAGDQAAGGMVLMGNAISAPSGAVLSATQTSAAPLIERGIILAATTVNFGGSGLTADADGNYGEVVVLPTGAVTITTNTGENSPGVSLDANYSANGSVTLNGTGSPLVLTANGTNGEVWINAGSGSVTISASEFNLSANGTNGQVDVFANTGSIAFNGSGNPLSLTANGDNGQINVDASSGGITFNNSGGALTFSANGNNTQVNVNGYPLTFTGASLSVTANGNSSNFIGLGVGNNTQDGSGGIAFDITGATVIDASAAAGQSSGNINIWEDQVTINGTSFAMMVNGPSSGDGNAGALSLLWANTILNPATAASFSANGPSSGNGNGGSITYWPGSTAPTFGPDSGQLSIAARGGQAGGGGGTVNISGGNMSFTDDTNQPSLRTGHAGGTVSIERGNKPFSSTTNSAIDVSAPGVNGNGGTLIVSGGDMTFSGTGTFIANAGSSTGNGGTLSFSGGNMTFAGTGYTFAANAGSSQGNGGNITLNAFGPLNIGNGAGAVQFAANGVGTGNGGSVTISGLPIQTLNAGSISVSAGSSGGGNGGIISITSNFGMPTINGDLYANGVGSGNGGSISITTDSPVTLSSTGQLVAESLGTGDGGTISVNSQGPIVVNANSVLVTAGSVGNGGSITLNTTGTGADGLVTVNGDLNANAGSVGTGTGGPIKITSAGISLANSSNVTSNGGQSGAGGNITLSSTGTSPINLASSTFQALGGSSSGSGGNISIMGNGIMVSSPIDSSAQSPAAISGTVALTSTGGDISGSTATISANGNHTGQGLSISVTGSSGNVTIGALNANGNQSGDGAGGWITVSNPDGFVTLTGIASATGSGMGLGGQFQATTNSAPFTSSSSGIVVDAGSNAAAGANSSLINIQANSMAINGPLSANGGNLSNGGQITLGNSFNVTVAGPVNADAGNSGNGTGGTINFTSGAGPSAVTTNGILSAKGHGSGKGGSIIISSVAVFLNSPSFSVDGGTTGLGGSINVTSTGAVPGSTLSLTSGSMSARGGVATGTLGQITISAQTPILIGSSFTVDASALLGSSGAGGNITISAGNGAPPDKITNNGTITASGGINAPAGQITLNATDLELGSGATILADANGTGSGGTVSITPASGTSASPLIINGPGSISAAMGTIQATNEASSSVSFNVASLTGNVQSTGNFVDIAVASSTDLVLGTTSAQKDITINNTGTGNILTASGATLSGRTLIVSPGQGNVGSSSQPLNVNVTGLTSTAQSSGSGSVYILENGTNTLTITDGATSNGAFSVTSASGLTANSINAGSDSNNVGISLISNGGRLNVNTAIGPFDATLQTTAVLYLQGASIVIGSGDRINAHGNVFVSVNGAGGATNMDPAGRPANVSVTNNGTIYWNAGLQALGTVFFDNTGARLILVDPNGNSGKIQVQNGTIINALP
ncbi:MAG TPA: hypothetical protein V6C86_00290 [Oculatellaceae cyanobacterium]